MAKYKKRKDGRYTSSINIGLKENGKPEKIFIYGKSIKELESNRIEALMNLKNGTFIRNKEVLFEEYAKKWLKSKKIGISTSFYDKIEYGDRNPSFNFITLFKEAFPKAEVDEIFFKNDEHEECD